MYNYIWDQDTGGYVLDTKIAGVVKDLRPVFHEELDLLGFNKFWKYRHSDKPLLWAETRRYIYKGELVAEVAGGGLYTQPILKVHKEGLKLQPVNIAAMISKNKTTLDALVQDTGEKIYKTYNDYKSKVDVTYVAFSGGKDSIVLLDLVQRTLPHDSFKVIFGDTTMEIRDTYKAVEKAKQRWPDLEFYTAKSHMDAKDTWRIFGIPSRTLRWCCSVHKSVPSLLKLREITGQMKLRALAFDGIRAEESLNRGTYGMVSEGVKHTIQINAHPLLNWDTTELYLYMLAEDLFLNLAYRYGTVRVGCLVCPLASEWREFIIERQYPDEVSPFLCLIDDNLKSKIQNKIDRQAYIVKGGWKGRRDGRNTNKEGNRILEQHTGDLFKLFINGNSINWKEWLKPIGYLNQTGEDTFELTYGDSRYPFSVSQSAKGIEIALQKQSLKKDYIRFLYLFKNSFYKSAYCTACRTCEVECRFGALTFANSKAQIDITKCVHCEKCLDMDQGCLVAKSQMFLTGGRNVSIKGLGNYNGFGFEKSWLGHYLKYGNDLWSSEVDALGKPKKDALKIWLRESEITINNSKSEFGEEVLKMGVDNPITWELILVNLAYNAAIMKWYIKNAQFDTRYEAIDLKTMLGDSYVASASTKDNAMDSLKKTFRHSPLGNEIGVGKCEIKGNEVISITRARIDNPAALVLLYALYKFAEKCDGYYAFTLTYLCDDSIERGGISPTRIFGIGADTMKEKFVWQVQWGPPSAVKKGTTNGSLINTQIMSLSSSSGSL